MLEIMIELLQYHKFFSMEKEHIWVIKRKLNNIYKGIHDKIIKIRIIEGKKDIII